MVGARPVATTSAPVIFTPQTGWALLVYLLQPLMGDSVVEGRSYLEGKVGEKIAAQGVTVRDNALLDQGVNRRSFDAEGSPTSNLVLVENGVLRNYLTDLGSSFRLGVPCGGNANRDSYATGIEIGSSNCYMEPGEQSPEEIIAATERGLLVTLLAGWWVGLSPSKDVFSSAAWGHWIENGKKVHPVRGVSVGGTLREMLDKIDMIGNDLETYGRTSTPTFRVSEMAISGV
jgi:PmbA protein